ncbi:MAG: GNAT family N-acetyltransferase [Candidatus Delongbacteria bacterium]|jgi:ribosomal protein S18 acetylase RimI-like enzyme|nr:GNAT family N-acetyltransferase [Candidatus Delongbacteria bacterium]
MTIKIEETTNTLLLAKLNHDVQEIHSKIEPEIFKPHSLDNMQILFDSALQREDVSAFVAYYEEYPAGYLLLQTRNYPETPYMKKHSAICIEHICVESKYKGKGVGKALVDFAKVFAEENNVDRIELDFWTGNKNAGEFFSSQGFSTYNEKMCLKLK